MRLDSGNVYRAPNLDALHWLKHGFGTRLSIGWPAAEQLATVKQIHSDRVVLADRAGNFGEGDALISNTPGLTLSVRTADCLPILMADSVHKSVAAIHAGWRGVAQEIVPKAIQAMNQAFGTNPEDLVVAIGPGIGPCCFEVGPEVSTQFGLTGRTNIDLPETIIRQLRRYGVTMGQVDTVQLCTKCKPDLFESYRRDKEKSGRMISAIEVV